MAYIVGSLADLISGSDSSKSKDSKIFQGNAESKVKIEYLAAKTVTHKRKLKDLTSSGSYDPTQKRKKIFHQENDNESSDVQLPFPTENNAQKRLRLKQKHKERKQLFEERKQFFDVAKESRTVFVKNLPNKLKKSKIKKVFGIYGEIESVRLRCAPLADPRVPKKVAIIKGKFHPERSNISAFVCFTSEKSADKALAANGTVVADHHILVDKAIQTYEHDQRKAIFVGNCPFAAEEDDLWKTFENCGKIIDVRIIRDKKTGIGKGFAYVNFESADAVELALNLNGEKLKDRELRVTRATRQNNTSEGKEKSLHNYSRKGKTPNTETKKTKKQKIKHEKRRIENISNIERKKKKIMNEEELIAEDTEHNDHETKKTKYETIIKIDVKSENIPFTTKNAMFQGQKITNKKKLKKKKKMNKSEIAKKIMIEKLAVKTKPRSKKIKFKPGH